MLSVFPSAHPGGQTNLGVPDGSAASYVHCPLVQPTFEMPVKSFAHFTNRGVVCSLLTL